MLPLGSRSTTLERQGRKNEMRGLDSNHGRLALAREHAGFKSARQAAQAMGWVYATYASHESGLRDFPQKVAEKYARAFRVAPEFLMFGTNPPEWAQVNVVRLATNPTPATTRVLPLFVDTQADALRAWLEGSSEGVKQFVITDPGNMSARCIALSITSAAMRDKPPVAGEREILPGDTAIVDTEIVHFHPGDTVVLLLPSDSNIHLRKVIMQAGGKMVYAALNRDYGEFLEAEVVGRVVCVLTAL